jgi:DNA-binding transcriptional MerR regulator
MEPVQPCFEMMDKSGDAYRTISEAAEELDLPQHVLRFWETRFPQIRPMKRGGGRRYYRPDDLVLLRAIRHLLYDEGYTIKGVQRMLKEQGARATAQLVAAGGAGAAARATLAPQADDGEPEVIYDASDDEGERIEPSFQAPASGHAPTSLAPPSPPVPFPLDAPLVSRAPTFDPMRDSPRAPAPAQRAAGLSADERARLEAVLADLDECRRILQSASL